MKLGWHTKHFKSAFKIFKSSKSILLVAPLAGIVGLGGLIDSTLFFYTYSLTLFSRATFEVGLFLGNPILILLLFIVLAVSFISLNLIVLNSFSIVRRRKILGFRSFGEASSRMLKSAFIAGLALVAVFIVMVPFYYLFNSEFVASSVFLHLFFGVIFSVLILFILTLKMISLHIAISNDVGIVESIKRSYSYVSRSPLVCVEHNIVLMLINLFAIFVTYVVGSVLIVTFSTVWLGLTGDVDIGVQIFTSYSITSTCSAFYFEVFI